MTAVPPAPPPFPVPPTGPAPRRRTRRVGFALMALGVLAGLALLYVGGARIDDAVSKLARAPLGCETVLEIDSTAVYTISVERRGDLVAAPGSCAAPTGSFSSGDATPSTDQLVVRVFDASGAEIALRPVDAVRYGSPSGEGESFAEVVLGPGRATVMVDWSDRATSRDIAPVVVSIGGAPTDAGSTWAVFGLVSIVVGLIGGSLLVLLGRRRPTPNRPAASPRWAPPTG